MERFARILLLYLMFSASESRAQIPLIDSLKKNIASAAAGQAKLEALFSLCDKQYCLGSDTLIHYAAAAKKIAEQLGDKNGDMKAMYFLSVAMLIKGSYDSVITTCTALADKLQNSADKKLFHAVRLLKAFALIRDNQFKEALSFLYTFLHDAEGTTDTLTQIRIKSSIGWVNMEMDQNKEALLWFQKALHTTSNVTILKQYGTLFSNMAATYDNLLQDDSAVYFIQIAIDYNRQNQEINNLANALNIRADIYLHLNNFNAAEKDLNEALNLRKKIGDAFYIVSDMAEMGNFYAAIHQPKKGINIILNGIEIAEKENLFVKLPLLYRSLAENYRLIGDNAKYAAVLERIIILKDSVYQVNSAEYLASLQAKYDLQKKETLIIQQKLDLQKKNYFFYGSLFLSLIIAAIGWLLFKDYKRKQIHKILVMQEQEKIFSAIAVTKAQETERKRIAADLHDNLGAYAAAIANNVEQIGLNQENNTALHELKINSQSIVSQLNDTIWVLKKDNLSLTAISDRIKVFILRISPSYPEISIDVIEQINSDILLPPAQAFHLYQITKEAIINSLKHSLAKHVRIYFESNTTFKITIADDGKGIHELDKKMGNGNGLQNMKARSRESGWQIEWVKNEQAGISVVISNTTN